MSLDSNTTQKLGRIRMLLQIAANGLGEADILFNEIAQEQQKQSIEAAKAKAAEQAAKAKEEASKKA